MALLLEGREETGDVGVIVLDREGVVVDRLGVRVVERLGLGRELSAISGRGVRGVSLLAHAALAPLALVLAGLLAAVHGHDPRSAGRRIGRLDFGPDVNVVSRPMTARRLTPDVVPAFVREELFAPTRQRPVVGLSTHVHPTRLLMDAERLAAELADHADVVVLETGEVTWTLSSELPPRLDVYGGAARIWWPGLTPSSNPHDHPLMFVFDPGDARRGEQRIRAAILGQDTRAGRYGAWEPTAEAQTDAGAAEAGDADDVVEAVLADIGDHAVTVTVEGATCVVDPADCAPESVPADVRLGHELRVRRTERTLDGLSVVEVRGVHQDPWRRLAELFQTGDVVRGQVCRVEDRYILVEVLPGAALIAPIGELDWTFVRSAADLFHVGDRVRARILSLETERHRGMLSIKQACTDPEPPPVTLSLGHPPFLAEGDEAQQSDGAAAEPVREELTEGEGLRREMAAALEDRADLLAANKALKEQVSELRRELRRAEDRLRDVHSRVSGDLDPTESEVAFLAAVRVAYARRLDEGDRQRYLLARMRVGREFLERLRNLEGVAVEKVVEVCAQVACQRAHEIPAREVHPLRSGSAGAPSRDRARDGARGWRCSLQDGTASARRLHWWDIPGKDGRTIEFASVGLHDDFSIPD